MSFCTALAPLQGMPSPTDMSLCLHAMRKLNGQQGIWMSNLPPAQLLILWVFTGASPQRGSSACVHRSKKRRIEDVDDEHHGEFDANELRQHEEFTKVKNVDSVELGQYQMETWYFSPLPAEYNNCKVRRLSCYSVCHRCSLGCLLAVHAKSVTDCLAESGIFVSLAR